MAMTMLTVEVGQQPTEEQIREMEAAALLPPVRAGMGTDEKKTGP